MSGAMGPVTGQDGVAMFALSQLNINGLPGRTGARDDVSWQPSLPLRPYRSRRPSGPRLARVLVPPPAAPEAARHTPAPVSYLIKPSYSDRVKGGVMWTIRIYGEFTQSSLYY